MDRERERKRVRERELVYVCELIGANSNAKQ